MYFNIVNYNKELDKSTLLNSTILYIKYILNYFKFIII